MTPCCEFHVPPDPGWPAGSCDGGQEPCCDGCPDHAETGDDR
jgi:hypothetical protein